MKREEKSYENCVRFNHSLCLVMLRYVMEMCDV